MRKTSYKNHTNHAPEADASDESWLISYADMVTLLFGFFVVLYSFSSVDSEKFEAMSQGVAEAFNAPESEAAKVRRDSEIDDANRELRAFYMLLSMLNFKGELGDSIDRIEKLFSEKKTAAATDDYVASELQTLSRSMSSDKATSMAAKARTLELQLP
jgi:chemotaxis protein MotB